MAEADEATVQALAAMGFEREIVLTALKQTNGNVDQAANLLLGSAEVEQPPPLLTNAPANMTVDNPERPAAPVLGTTAAPIDLVGPSAGVKPAGGEDAELQRAIQASLQEQQAPPRVGTDGARTDADLNRAIEQSLKDAGGGFSVSPAEMRRLSGMPVGLKNIGNTCYFNALLQVYFSLPKIRRAILGYRTPEERGRAPATGTAALHVKFVAELRALFARLLLGNKKYIDPTALLNSLHNDKGVKVEIGMQQDIGEANLLVLEAVAKGFAASEGTLPPDEEDKENKENKEEHGDNGGEDDGASAMATDDGHPSDDGGAQANPSQQQQQQQQSQDMGAGAMQTEQEGSNPGEGIARLFSSQEVRVFRAEEADGSQALVKKRASELHVLLDLSSEASTSHLLRSPAVKSAGTQPTVALGPAPGGAAAEAPAASIDLHDSLAAYVAPEPVEWETPQGRHTTAQKQVWFERTPEVLMLQLQRVSYDRERMEPVKLHTEVQFEKDMYMDRYLYENHETVAVKRDAEAQLKEKLAELQGDLAQYVNYNGSQMNLLHILSQAAQFFVDPRFTRVHGAGSECQTMNSSLTTHAATIATQIDSLQRDVQRVRSDLKAVFSDMQRNPYRLHGIIVHEGVAASGHYWCFLYNRAKNQWLRVNDMHASVVDEETVKRESFGGFRTCSAYSLVYVEKEEEETEEEDEGHGGGGGGNGKTGQEQRASTNPAAVVDVDAVDTNGMQDAETEADAALLLAAVRDMIVEENKAFEQSIAEHQNKAVSEEIRRKTSSFVATLRGSIEMFDQAMDHKVKTPVTQANDARLDSFQCFLFFQGRKDFAHLALAEPVYAELFGGNLREDIADPTNERLVALHGEVQKAKLTLSLCLSADDQQAYDSFAKTFRHFCEVALFYIQGMQHAVDARPMDAILHLTLATRLDAAEPLVSLHSGALRRRQHLGVALAAVCHTTTYAVVRQLRALLDTRLQDTAALSATDLDNIGVYVNEQTRQLMSVAIAVDSALMPEYEPLKTELTEMIMGIIEDLGQVDALQDRLDTPELVMLLIGDADQTAALHTMLVAAQEEVYQAARPEHWVARLAEELERVSKPFMHSTADARRNCMALCTLTAMPT